MLPKKGKEFIQQAAVELDMDYQLVYDAVFFYYAVLRKSLSKLEAKNIQVEGLGNFHAKASEVSKLVHKHTRHLATLDSETLPRMRTMQDVTKKLNQATALKNLIDTEAARKKLFIEKKKKDGPTKAMGKQK